MFTNKDKEKAQPHQNGGAVLVFVCNYDKGVLFFYKEYDEI